MLESVLMMQNLEFEPWAMLSKSNASVDEHYTVGGVIGRRLYAFAGYKGSPLHYYDVDTATWVYPTVTGGPTALSWSYGGCTLGDKLYVFGNASLTLWIYNSTTNSWISKTAPSTLGTVNNPSMVSYQNSIYILFSSKLWKYDTVADTWTQLSSVGIPTSWVFGITWVYDDELYFQGGSTDRNAYSGSAQLHKYNPASNTWTRLADTPTSLFQNSGGVVNGIAYSYQSFPIGTPAYDSFYSYNIATNTWVKLPPPANIPVAEIVSRGSKAYVVDNTIYFYSGYQRGNRLISYTP